MNVFQQIKAIKYSVNHLEKEIFSLKRTLETAKNAAVAGRLEKLLEELESELKMFQELEGIYERYAI